MNPTPRPAAIAAAAALGLLLLVAAAPTPARAQQLPQVLDGDGDGSADNLEAALGSDPGSDASAPESFALADGDGNGVADACEDGRDNDGDGLTDGGDPGCDEPVPSVDLGPGVDVFTSRARFTAGSAGPTEFSGPAVVARRNLRGDGSLAVEMVAFQMTSADGRVTLVEDPAAASKGTVREVDGESTWSTEFDINFRVVAGGREVSRASEKMAAAKIETLPPVQQGGGLTPNCEPPCYRAIGTAGSRHCHCPITVQLRVPVKVYVAKFDCGQQPSAAPPFLGPVTPGLYATKIVVHNPSDRTVEPTKKVSVGLRNPRTGPVTKPPEKFKLKANETTEIDCPDIWRMLGTTMAQGFPADFVNGVVEIVSRQPLDVIANYTQEVPKEKIEFRVWPCCDKESPLEKVAGRRLKSVTLVTEDRLIDEEHEARRALLNAFPNAQEAVAKAHIEILGDELGVGSSFDVEPIEARKCLLVGPPNRLRLDCSQRAEQAHKPPHRPPPHKPGDGYRQPDDRHDPPRGPVPTPEQRPPAPPPGG